MRIHRWTPLRTHFHVSIRSSQWVCRLDRWWIFRASTRVALRSTLQNKKNKNKTVHVCGGLIFKNMKQSHLNHVLLYGASQSMVTVFTNPIEIFKVRAQLGLRAPSSFSCLTRGVDVAMTREYMKGVVRIGLNKPAIQYVENSFGRPPKKSSRLLQSVGISSACGALSAVVCNPADILKTRSQYMGTGRAIQTLRTECRAASVSSVLMRGANTSILRSMVSTGSLVPMKNICDDMYIQTFPYSSYVTRTIATSSVASVVSVLCTQPFDFLRNRLYGNVSIYDTCAPVQKLMWRGTFSHVARTVPHGVGTFLLFEVASRALMEN